MPAQPRDLNPTRLEVTGTLTLERINPTGGKRDAATSGVGSDPITIGLSTGDDHTITIDVLQTPPVQELGSLTRRLWKLRSGLATSLTNIGQPVRVRVAGQTWLSIEIAPSRLGRLLKMPGLTLRLAGASILKQRFGKK